MDAPFERPAISRRARTRPLFARSSRSVRLKETGSAVRSSRSDPEHEHRADRREERARAFPSNETRRNVLRAPTATRPIPTVPTRGRSTTRNQHQAEGDAVSEIAASSTTRPVGQGMIRTDTPAYGEEAWIRSPRGKMGACVLLLGHVVVVMTGARGHGRGREGPPRGRGKARAPATRAQTGCGSTARRSRPDHEQARRRGSSTDTRSSGSTNSERGERHEAEREDADRVVTVGRCPRARARRAHRPWSDEVGGDDRLAVSRRERVCRPEEREGERDEDEVMLK